MGGAGVVVHPGHQEAERGGDHEGPLAEVWQKLLHQVRNVNVREFLPNPSLAPSSGWSENCNPVFKSRRYFGRLNSFKNRLEFIKLLKIYSTLLDNLKRIGLVETIM